MTFAAIALVAGLQAAAPDTTVPTAIEHAIVEFQCRATRVINGAGSDADQRCYNAQLVTLRAEFGRDLARLSAAERKNFDTACGQFSEPQRRDAYVECLNTELTTMRNRRNRGKPPAVADAGTPAAADSAPVTLPVAPPPTAASPFGVSYTVLIGVAVGAVLLAAGLIVALRSRPQHRKCRVCGAVVEQSGDLCSRCRHEAAASLRRASSQRSDSERVERERLRRLAQLEEERRREQARREEEERIRKQEDTVRLERLARERQEEETRQRRQFGSADPEDAFDPHAILGVSRDASRDDIQAAYVAAMQKYDLHEVAHLGPELQEHYKAKAAAVERAFKALTERAGGAGGAGGAGPAGEAGPAG